MLSLDKVFNAQTVRKSIIADCGGNVTGVHDEKENTESVNGCFLRIEMETGDAEHVNLIHGP